MTHEYEATSLRNVPFQYAPGDGHVYRWHGGAYVDVFLATDIIGDNPDAAPVETINVWDYETDQPRIRRTGQALATAVEDWRHARRVAAHPGE